MKDTIAEVENTETSTQEEAATGVFNDCQIIKYGYKFRILSENVGHPSPEADFDTYYDWQDTDHTETDVAIKYNVKQGSLKDSYVESDSQNVIVIDNKNMMYVARDDMQLFLLYEITDEVYLEIELLEMNCFDNESGNSIALQSNIEDILKNQDFLQGIHIEIEEE